MGLYPARRDFKTESNKMVIVHRKDAEVAEGYLFLLFAERPKSKKTQPGRIILLIRSQFALYRLSQGAH